jgi:probable selenate reductase FAD-binding subunit
MPQLKAYHRPKTVPEALQLLARPQINTVVLAGGVRAIVRLSEIVDEVVDLQAIDLTQVDFTGKGVILGAMVRLQTLVDDNRMPGLLRETARREGPNTIRHAATIGGAIAGPQRDSELLAALLVLDAQVKIQTITDTKTISLNDFLLDVPAALSSGLIISVSLATMGKTATARVGRTPADTSIVAAIGRIADDGQIRLALTGVANLPVLVDPNNVKAAVNPISDFRGSKEYRRHMAAILTKRVLAELTGA